MANVGTDTFTGVRDVRGSQFGDTLVGSDGEGFESFRGMGGDDFIGGGAGDFDRVDYGTRRTVCSWICRLVSHRTVRAARIRW